MMTIAPNNNHSSHHASHWDFMTANATSSSFTPVSEADAGVVSSFDSIFQAQSPPDDVSHLSVSDILSTYKHDTDLMKHVLAAKAQEDRRKTAEEFRQMEEARLRFRFTDFDMDEYQKPDYPEIEKEDSNAPHGTSSSAFSHQNSSHAYAESSLQAGKHDDSPHLDVLLSSPPSVLMEQDIPSIYMDNHHQSNESIPVLEVPIVPSHDFHLNVPTSNSYSLSPSHSPSFASHSHFISPSPTMGYREPSPSIRSTVKISISDSDEKISGTNKANKKKSSSPSASTKQHRRRQSSTTIMPGFSSSTHILRWAAPKKKRPVQLPIVNVNQEPQVPLDHGVVMNALRSKLMRAKSLPTSTDSIASSSSTPPPHAPSSPRPSTTDTRTSPVPKSPSPPAPPRSPPVDTQPTTGILFLDLKNKTNRRKKAS